MGNPSGLRVRLVQGNEVGPLGPLTLEFSQPIEAVIVEQALRLEPEIPIRVIAETSTRLRLRPVHSLSKGQPYTLRLNTGRFGVNGESVKNEKTWLVHTRPEQVVFLGAGPKPQEIYRVSLDNSAPVALTTTEGRIYDFDVAPDGEQIAYSVLNDQKGTDIWLVDRNGANTRKLLVCGPDLCTTPDWSPDGAKLAYTRQAAGLAPGEPLGAPRPWVLDISRLQTSLLYADDQMISYGPSWSPDGGRLATWDGVNGGIRVLDLSTGKQTFLQTESGQIGGWSPDGNQMYFTRYGVVEEGYFAFVYRADFSTGEISTFIEAGDHDSAYGTPAVSPDGQRIALSLRFDENSPARTIWLIRPDFLGGTTVGNELDRFYSYYSWDPWGTALVFQSVGLVGKQASQIAVYRPDKSELQVIAENGSRPQWLP
jgi:Tol biopolymer transport system component